MFARLVRSADFERVLRTRTRASSTHFALHHLPDRPSRPQRRSNADESAELSTAKIPTPSQAVDDSPRFGVGPAALEGVWLGTVVPKRHARRAVTRALLKRQIRSVVGGRASALSAGLWVVRLRAPFDVKVFVSAASDALKQAARAELEALVTSAAPRAAGNR